MAPGSCPEQRGWRVRVLRLWGAAGVAATWRHAVIIAAAVWVVVDGVGMVPDWAWSAKVAVARSRVEARTNCDIALIYAGIREVPTLRDTLRWWHRVWAGKVPYWRPLTSLVFWLEYHAFGPDRLDGWVWVSVAAHLAVTWLAAALGTRLVGHWWAGPVVAVVFGTRLLALRVRGSVGPGPESVGAVIAMPALQQEVWVTLPALGAMVAATSRRWLLALSLCGLAVSAKEMGWTSFPLCLIAVAIVHGRRGLGAIPRWAWAMGIALVALLVWARWCAGPEVFRGFHMGTNIYWRMRLINVAGGHWLVIARSPTWTPALWAALAFAAWVPWGRRGRGRLWTVSAAAGLCIAAWAQALSWSIPFDAALTQLLTVPKQVCDSLFCFISLCVLWAFFQRPAGRDLRAMVLCMFAVAAPYAAAAQVQGHALYLQRVFIAMLIPVCALALDECLRRRHTSAAPGEAAATPEEDAATSASSPDEDGPR